LAADVRSYLPGAVLDRGDDAEHWRQSPSRTTFAVVVVQLGDPL
jgi:hypothetical protein